MKDHAKLESVRKILARMIRDVVDRSSDRG